jgi:putative endonuclease
MGVFKKWTERAGPGKVAADTPAISANSTAAAAGHTKARGDAAEDRALAALLGEGLTLVQRNYRVARGPHARGGEVDLVMRDRDGTLVFVEVRQRSHRQQGGAAASVGASKQRRLVYAAQHYLLRLAIPPPCRFDVVAIDGEALQWLPGAFDAP